MTIRPVLPGELAALTALNLRAKAHWGYDAAFMAACVKELTVQPAYLGPGLVCWDIGAGPEGVVRVTTDGAAAELELIFVDPPAIGQGIGRRLFEWATAYARAQGASHMGIDSDPYADPFYTHMGARQVGEAPSGSIPGRMLPRLHLDLT